jgi:hypothetical protein
MRTRWKGCGGILFGGIFTVVGLVVALLLPGIIHQQANQLSQREPLSAVVLADSAPGREVLAEGRVSPNNRTVRGALVAYVYERLVSDSDGDRSWRHYRSETPPLLIDLPDGRIQVARGYDLQQLSGNNTEQHNDERYRGLQRGDAVLVVGTLAPSRELPRINAEFVAGGTRDTYIANQHATAQAISLIGWIFSGIGLLVVGSGSVLILRSMI